MTEAALAEIRHLLAQCSPQEKETLFRELRQGHYIHEFEQIVGAPAEMILDAVHRAPELTRRMLRGVIADAAFRTFVVPSLVGQGWRDATPEGNFAYDYKLEDAVGPVTVQIKLQRSEKGRPAERPGDRYELPGTVFVVETQKTRTGTDGEANKTRPYRFGEFDVLAVSMQPSTGKWDRYLYTVARWLLPGQSSDQIGIFQPVTKLPSDFWTESFTTAAQWLRASDGGKRMTDSRAQRRDQKKQRP